MAFYERGNRRDRHRHRKDPTAHNRLRRTDDDVAVLRFISVQLLGRVYSPRSGQKGRRFVDGDTAGGDISCLRLINFHVETIKKICFVLLVQIFLRCKIESTGGL